MNKKMHVIERYFLKKNQIKFETIKHTKTIDNEIYETSR
jgi:hypothetical protein